MKRILFILSMLIGVAYGQTTGFFRYDTVAFQKTGGNAEFNLYNATRNVTNGILINKGGGRTSFSTMAVAKNTTRDSIIFTLGTLRIAVKDSVGSGGGGGSLTPLGTYKIGVSGTSNVKGLIPGVWKLFDSTGTNITINSDSAIITAYVKQRTGKTWYLCLTGQSNAGAYNFGNVDTASNPRVRAWDPVTHKWVLFQRTNFPSGSYTPGLHWSTAGFDTDKDSSTSVAFYLAKRMAERFPNDTIKVFLLAWGGSSITNWMPNGTYFSTINAELAAAGNPHLDYFMWFQGETDALMQDSVYLHKMDTLMLTLDSKPYFGKDVPVFIYTVSRTFSDQNKINQIQKAIGSGMYDPRYVLIDMSDEPGIGDAYHFNAQAMYNGANKTINAIFSPMRLTNRLRVASSAERAYAVSYVPLIGKGLIVTDSVTRLNYSFTGAAWKEMAGGTIAGSNKQVIFNNAGSLDGSAGLTFDPATNLTTAVDIKATGLMATGVLTSPTGVGPRLEYFSPDSYLSSFNNTGSVYVPLIYRASTHTFNNGSSTSIGISSANVITLPALASSTNAADSMMVWNPTSKAIGYRPIPSGGSVALSDVTAMTTDANIDNGDNILTWNFTGLTTNGMSVVSSSTAAGASTILHRVAVGGTNASSNRTTLAGSYSNTHGGTGAVNIALQLNATTGATNVALDIGSGDVRLNNNLLYGNSNAYNDQTGTTYTLVAADNGKIVTIDNGSGITLTVPASLPAGFNCTIVQKGAGQITFTASSTTINNRQSFTKTKGQYSMVTIVQYTTNTFITQGDME